MTTLAKITQTLEALCDEIDNSEDLPKDLLDRFTTAKMEHADKVGAYVYVIETLKMNALLLEERSKLLAKRAKTAKRLESEIKERLKFQVETCPYLPWKSPEGDRIAIRNNPESLKVYIPLDHKHVNNVLNETIRIHAEFITVSTFYQLNTDAVREFLKMGGALDWARLEHGTHLRIY